MRRTDGPLLSFAEAAPLARCSEPTLRRWHRAGDLPAGVVLKLDNRH